MKVKLGDIFEIGSGGTPSKAHPEYYGGEIPWVKTGDLKSKYLYEAEDFITNDGLKNSSAKMYEPDTVLIAMYGATIGATSILKMFACTNQACAAFRKNDKVIPEFLYYFLKSRKERFIKDGVGGAQPNISAGYLKKVEIELPPLEEQQVIVNILDKASSIILGKKYEIQLLDELVKARFVEMFGDEKNELIRLGDVCIKITDGTHKTPKYLDRGITFISAKNIVNGELNFSDVKYISEDEYMEIQKRCQTELNDILLSKSGSLGEPVIVKSEERLGLFESLAIIKYDRNKLLPEFLCEQLKTEKIQRQFRTGTKGVAVKHLHLGVIADIGIIVPPIELQNQFADFVRAIDKSKVAIKKSLDETQILFDSLMQKYFG